MPIAVKITQNHGCMEGYIAVMSYANGAEGWGFPRVMSPPESNDMETSIHKKLESMYADDD